jgi:hypothetical protein
MHWRTYSRLCSKAASQEQLVIGGTLALVASLKRQIIRNTED